MFGKLEELLGLDRGEVDDYLIDLGIRLGTALVILIAGFWIARMAAKGLERILKIRGSDQSLIGFMRSLTSISIKVLVVITAITQLGVEMTSFVAILGAAGLAIGMAFSGTLSNFAGGVMILLFKPFKAGDFVDIQGEQGTVHEVQIFNTILTTGDNKVIILANGAVANNTIINYTRAEKRRVDWMFGITYGDDLEVARDILQKFMKEDKRILQEEEKFIGLGAMTDVAVTINVRAWVKTEDYWPVYYAMNENVYDEFGKAGLTIPQIAMGARLVN
jgi:small conductance mechanosensitive channel